MKAVFYVKACFALSGVGVIVSGDVTNGTVTEGAVGQTSHGKRGSVVKIEKEGERRTSVTVGEKASLTMKHVSRGDVPAGETIYFD